MLICSLSLGSTNFNQNIKENFIITYLEKSKKEGKGIYARKNATK